MNYFLERRGGDHQRLTFHTAVFPTEGNKSYAEWSAITINAKMRPVSTSVNTNQQGCSQNEVYLLKKLQPDLNLSKGRKLQFLSFHLCPVLSLVVSYTVISLESLQEPLLKVLVLLFPFIHTTEQRLTMLDLLGKWQDQDSNHQNLKHRTNE